jgi:outer membrane protein OmpU
MNNFKKIGLSALAGSLVAVSAQAADVSLSGGASVAFTSAFDSDKTGYYMNDSVTMTISGETDNGLTVTTSLELDGAGAASTGSFDNRSIKIGNDEMGTITFAGHGGDSVIGGWDDVMPTAYEEVFALTKKKADGATDGNTVIAGYGGNNLWRYDSPSISGASFHMAYQSTGTTAASGGTPARVSSYSDMGIQIAPEMVEGLSIGYAVGEYDETATKSIDVSTLWVKYAVGSFTVGVQESERDGSAAADHDSSDSWGVSYAVNDDFSVSYGQHTYEEGTSTTEQESSGFSASYTSGGVSISAAFNSTDNIQNSATDDEDSYEIAFSFAF